jgi:exoribonuclease R
MHCTSPIRRLVDLINIILLNNYIGEGIRTDIVDKWKSSVEIINQNQKSIKKISSRAFLLKAFMENPEKIYTGVFVDEKTVYLGEIRQFVKYKGVEQDVGKFMIYVFNNEYDYYSKVKIRLVE